MNYETTEKEKHIINVDEENAIRIWDCSKSKPTKLHKMMFDEKGTLLETILKLK